MGSKEQRAKRRTSHIIMNHQIIKGMKCQNKGEERGKGVGDILVAARVGDCRNSIIRSNRSSFLKTESPRFLGRDI